MIIIKCRKCGKELIESEESIFISPNIVKYCEDCLKEILLKLGIRWEVIEV